MSVRKTVILILLMLACATGAEAAITRVYGVVMDSVAGEPVPYSAIYLVGSQRGMMTDGEGRFDISVNTPFTALRASAMGYDTREISVPLGVETELTVSLVPSGVRLDEVTIKPGKEHYSKKNNPAVMFAERLRNSADLTDPRRNSDYSYDKYERITLGLNNFDPGNTEEGKGGGWLLKRFPFLVEHIDTSEVSGRKILNLALREKSSSVFYRREPRNEKEYIKGLRNTGIDNMLDQQSMQLFYEDVLREVDIYDDDIVILQNHFVSPLSRIASDFYKFYLTDTVTVDSVSCVELTFVPHNPRSFGFTGRLYVERDDSSMFVRKALLNVPHNINLNFIDYLRIVQKFDRGADGSRLKTSDDMVIEASIIPGTQGLYARRNTVYDGHNFNPAPDQRIFAHGGYQIKDRKADSRDDTFWANGRKAAISEGESSIELMMKRMREVPVYYWTEKIIKILVTGYVSIGENSKFDFGPMNTTISNNSVEGWRLRAGGITTANLSRRWFGRGYVAYGFKDHRWKYGVEAEYSFRDKEYHSREFPIHSIRATHLYDVDMLGQHYLFTNPDNVFLSLKRAKDLQMTYHRVSKLEYTLELENNFSVVGGVHNVRQESTPLMTFTNGAGESFGHYTMTSLELQLRYAPGEKFYQSKTNRYPINLDAPVFMLTHSFAPGGMGGNRMTYNKTELSVQKRFWFSAFGYTDIIVKGAHVWSRANYPNLLIPNANLSYTIQPESFALMNPMEFINDSYASWDVTYWANGAIFNYIPLLRSLKLREVFNFRGVAGHLSDRNDPELHPELFRFPEIAHTRRMTSTPYMEASAGIDNIFRILRVDYVWRLTYRDSYDISRGGVRIALHFSF